MVMAGSNLSELPFPDEVNDVCCSQVADALRSQQRLDAPLPTGSNRCLELRWQINWLCVKNVSERRIMRGLALSGGDRGSTTGRAKVLRTIAEADRSCSGRRRAQR
jgi:hypothetical protein